MHSADSNAASGPDVQQVARKFIGLYYRVLNSYPSYLFQFYGSDSTVVVCEAKEDGHPLTMKAENMTCVQELLRAVYEETTIAVRNCTPQPSSGGCISLLVTGVMSQKPPSKDRAFTQALILSRQSDGYYIKTDTVLIFPMANWPTGSSGMLPSSFSAMETMTESMEDMGLRGGHQAGTEEKSHHGASDGVQSSKARIPPIEFKNGVPLVSAIKGNVQRMNGQVDGIMPMTENKGTFTFDVRPRGLHGALENHSVPIDAIKQNRQGSRVLNDGSSSTAYCGVVSPMNILKDRCSSPLSAPGGLVSPITGDADLGRFHRQQPWSLKSSPRTCATNTNPRTPNVNESNRLFACKLPLRSTVEAVTEVFSKYGTLAEEEPVRVFTGQNNCYACITYETEQDMQKALDAEIHIGNSLVVTDAWRPRDRRPKRRRPENAPEQAAIATAN